MNWTDINAKWLCVPVEINNPIDFTTPPETGFKIESSELDGKPCDCQ